MVLSDYFDPIEYPVSIKGKYLPEKLTLGNYINENNKKLANLGYNNINTAIIGVPVQNGRLQNKRDNSPDLIRKELYNLSLIETNLKIVDLGNLKPSKSVKGTMLALRDIIEYLRKQHITTIVIGGSQDLTFGICQAFKDEKFFWLSVIDAAYDGYTVKKTSKSTNYLSSILKDNPELFQFSLIGYQQHLTGDMFPGITKKQGSHLRLGELRTDIKQAEVLLRNSNVVSFDISSLKHHEAPAASKKNPNGLYGEEACQLALYSGMSQKLEVFGIFEMLPDKKDLVSPAITAEIIWYFLKGLSNRPSENIETAYKVEIEGMEAPIVFRYDWELDRWWIEIDTESGEVIKIACSEKDYQQAAGNEIPERWLHFIQKMDSMSK